MRAARSRASGPGRPTACPRAGRRAGGAPGRGRSALEHLLAALRVAVAEGCRGAGSRRRKPAEEPTALGHQRDAEVDAIRRLDVVDAMAVEPDLAARGRQQPGDGLEQRGLAGAVARRPGRPSRRRAPRSTRPGARPRPCRRPRARRAPRASRRPPSLSGSSAGSRVCRHDVGRGQGAPPGGTPPVDGVPDARPQVRLSEKPS